MSPIGRPDKTSPMFNEPTQQQSERERCLSAPIKTAGFKKQRCAVMLTVTADVRKLTPCDIFERKTVPNMNLGGRFHLHAQKNAKQPLTLPELLRQLKMREGQELPFKHHSFCGPLRFLLSLPDAVRLTRVGGETGFCQARSDKGSQAHTEFLQQPERVHSVSEPPAKYFQPSQQQSHRAQNFVHGHKVQNTREPDAGRFQARQQLQPAAGCATANAQLQPSVVPEETKDYLCHTSLTTSEVASMYFSWTNTISERLAARTIQHLAKGEQGLPA
ncbi:hypothetical protein HPB48_000813 [Haemaphysalis longicornis]|uniref:Uncharacterized protein n=1 Tax=Haemaphysalis longicornis TaxID=44386 RepID=A0A9J6GM21_HAELO|nr:hypothetical protein HPB48_000813 [Haemaphysalis longicornis]